MIQFSITLTVNQIACLRAIRAFADREVTRVFPDLPNWPAGVRLLLSEGLISHDMTPKVTQSGVKDGVKGWNITEKGRLLLRVIELDILDAAQAIEAGEKRLTGATAMQVASPAQTKETSHGNR